MKALFVLASYMVVLFPGAPNKVEAHDEEMEAIRFAIITFAYAAATGQEEVAAVHPVTTRGA